MFNLPTLKWGESVQVISDKRKTEQSLCSAALESSCFPFDVPSRVPQLSRRIHNCAIASLLRSVASVRLSLILSVIPVPWSHHNHHPHWHAVIRSQSWVGVSASCHFHWRGSYFSSKPSISRLGAASLKLPNLPWTFQTLSRICRALSKVHFSFTIST